MKGMAEEGTRGRLSDRIYKILRIGFGLLFIWASWDKIHNPAAFAEVIYNYRVLPDPLIHPAAIILPWLEMGCGILLVIGRIIGGSLVILNGLLLIFGTVLALSLYRGLDIDCGCFSVGSKGERVAWQALVRDLVLLGLGLSLMISEYKKRSGRYSLSAPGAGGVCNRSPAGPSIRRGGPVQRSGHGA
jgi:putative oxidoreductase